MNSDILHGFKSCTQYLISLCTICHACYFALHIYKSLALCLNCFWETPHFNSVWVLFSFSWITYSFYCCSVSNIVSPLLIYCTFFWKWFILFFQCRQRALHRRHSSLETHYSQWKRDREVHSRYMHLLSMQSYMLILKLWNIHMDFSGIN